MRPEPACVDETLPLPEAEPRNRYAAIAVCGLILLVVGLVYGQTVRHGFVNFDDDGYVYENPHVLHGLNVQGIVWAFTHVHTGYWIPSTWLSLMLDGQLYGLSARGFHLTNGLLHAATAILLFVVLRRMTGSLWPSALVAAIFAVHPLHVESVAWVTERKDVLSGLFFVLTLGAYEGYVRHRPSPARYLAVVVFFVLGLLAKPMLVTLPMVLLLLDYWPLGRMTAADAENTEAGGLSTNARFSIPMHLVFEKLPLLFLAAVSCLVTVWTQGEGLASKETISFSHRIANALVSYVAYVVQSVLPLRLAVFYPHPGDSLPVWKAAAALAVLACISAAALVCWRRSPYLLVGWLWYLGMLVPVSGVAQSGGQARADRFTYLPQIGLCLALAWFAAELCRSRSDRRDRRWLGGMASALVLAVLMGCAWRQTSFWRDSETLWRHTLACTLRNSLAHSSLGVALAAQGRLHEALAEYQEALEIDPGSVAAYYNLGVALAFQNRFDEAIPIYQKVLKSQPHFATAHFSLGSALARRGRLDEALAHYQLALEASPDFALAHDGAGSVLATQGRFDEALAHFHRALELQPNFAMAHNNLAGVLAHQGRFDEALTQYQQALEIQPNLVLAHDKLGDLLAIRGRFPEALVHYRTALEIQPGDPMVQRSLAWLRATCPLASLRNGAEALALAEQANRLYGGQRPDVLDTLAAAYAETGWFEEAQATARKALQLATQQDNRVLANGLRERIALYEARRPYRQTPPVPTSSP